MVPDDDDAMWLDFELPPARCKVKEYRGGYPLAEVEEMLEGLDDAVADRPVPPHIQKLTQAARAYELKRDRSQLVSDLERVCALAETMDDPVVTTSLREVLARVREAMS